MFRKKAEKTFEKSKTELHTEMGSEDVKKKGPRRMRKPNSSSSSAASRPINPRPATRTEKSEQSLPPSSTETPRRLEAERISLLITSPHHRWFIPQGFSRQGQNAVVALLVVQDKNTVLELEMLASQNLSHLGRWLQHSLTIEGTPSFSQDGSQIPHDRTLEKVFTPPWCHETGGGVLVAEFADVDSDSENEGEAGPESDHEELVPVDAEADEENYDSDVESVSGVRGKDMIQKYKQSRMFIFEEREDAADIDKPRRDLLSEGLEVHLTPLSKVEKHPMDGKPLVVELIKGRKIPRMDGLMGLCDPYVRIWLEDHKGKPKTKILRWPYKSQTRKPCWNTARNLGPAVGTDVVALELWDYDRLSSDDLIGKTLIRAHDLFLLADKAGKAEANGVELRRRDEVKGEVAIGVMPARVFSNSWRLKNRQMQLEMRALHNISTIPVKKTLFLLRHGQSIWNKAQSDRDVMAMLTHTDHPLNKKGIEQAGGLQSLITGSNLPADEQQFMNADVVLSSPLTRAIQTAIIGCLPILKRLQVLRLVANAREKRNFGGKDSSASTTGANIPRRVMRKLRKVVPSDKDISEYEKIRIDTFEVNDKWWLDQKEEKNEVMERLHEFLTQIRFMPEANIVIVGHSHFFRELFRLFLHEDFAEKHKDLTDKLCTRVIRNCGVAKLDLSFSPSGNGLEGCISHVKLLFGTDFA